MKGKEEFRVLGRDFLKKKCGTRQERMEESRGGPE